MHFINSLSQRSSLYKFSGLKVEGIMPKFESFSCRESVKVSEMKNEKRFTTRFYTRSRFIPPLNRALA